jgi:hypothetical protein
MMDAVNNSLKGQGLRSQASLRVINLEHPHETATVVEGEIDVLHSIVLLLLLCSIDNIL